MTCAGEPKPTCRLQTCRSPQGATHVLWPCERLSAADRRRPIARVPTAPAQPAREALGILGQPSPRPSGSAQPTLVPRHAVVALGRAHRVDRRNDYRADRTVADPIRRMTARRGDPETDLRDEDVILHSVVDGRHHQPEAASRRNASAVRHRLRSVLHAGRGEVRRVVAVHFGSRRCCNGEPPAAHPSLIRPRVEDLVGGHRPKHPGRSTADLARRTIVRDAGHCWPICRGTVDRPLLHLDVGGPAWPAVGRSGVPRDLRRGLLSAVRRGLRGGLGPRSSRRDFRCARHPGRVVPGVPVVADGPNWTKVGGRTA